MSRQRLVAALVTLVAAVLGLVLVERVGTTYRDGLDVTVDAAQVTAVGISSARALAEQVAGLAANTALVVDRAGDVVRDTTDVTADLATALQTNLAGGVDGTAGVADDLARFIEVVERFIPGNRDSLAEDLRRVADGLAPLPEQLRVLGKRLDATSDRLDDIAPALDAAADRVDEVSRRLADALVTLDEATVLAEQTAQRAEDAHNRAGGDLWIARALVVLVAGALWLVAAVGTRPGQSPSDAT